MTDLLVPPRPGDLALSLWQPWASLVALRVKWIETRNWSTGYRGPIIIHAAQKVSGRRGDVTVVGDYQITRDAAGYLMRGPVAWPYRLPLGAAVARANLVDVVPMVEPGRAVAEAREQGRRVLVVEDGRFMLGPAPWRDVTDQLPYGRFEPGRYAWLLEEWSAEPIEPTVPMRGRQRLWRVPADVASPAGR